MFRGLPPFRQATWGYHSWSPAGRVKRFRGYSEPHPLRTPGRFPGALEQAAPQMVSDCNVFRPSSVDVVPMVVCMLTLLCVHLVVAPRISGMRVYQPSRVHPIFLAEMRHSSASLGAAPSTPATDGPDRSLRAAPLRRRPAAGVLSELRRSPFDPEGPRSSPFGPTGRLRGRVQQLGPTPPECNPSLTNVVDICPKLVGLGPRLWPGSA